MKHRYLSTLAVLILITVAPLLSQVRLPRLVSDGMVLQRSADVKIWGWAAPSEKVKIEFLGKVSEAMANPQGEWSVVLSNLAPGGPYQMTIAASNTIKLNNILVGDVWLCSGQSNMELPIRRVWPKYEAELQDYNNTNIRQFAVPQTYDFNTPHNDLKSGSWKEATQANIKDFSAVAFFFANDVYQQQQVPIGLINASLGGSPVEAWMSEEALKPFPDQYSEMQRFKNNDLIAQIEAADNKRNFEWYSQLAKLDEGHFQCHPEWSSPLIDHSQWPVTTIPGYLSSTSLGAVNGAVWFRKEVELSAAAANQPANLNMGRIVDADSVFVNGVCVGTTSYQYPPRWYTVPANILKEGKNTIAVKVTINSGNGGFVPDKTYALTVDDETVDLTGEWHYQLGVKMDPLAGPTFVRWKPGGLYNAMIAPLGNYRIKGAIWFQGESNTGKPLEYRDHFAGMITDWRTTWHQGDFPFLYVQLANFMEAKDVPTESNWAALREAQLKALSVTNSAMAVAIDLGEWNDIHPLNKKDVGKRLAVAASAIAYNQPVEPMGPIYQSHQIKGNKIIINFSHTGKGLATLNHQPLTCFAISGDDKKFVWAQAKIKGDKVVVWNKDVTNPVAVRYAWADNPSGTILYSKDGLPASPFRTDEW
jgi:sialate O-acetylesterase